MHNQQHCQEPGGIEGLKHNLGRGLFVCDCLAATLVVFLHRRFGRRWGGLHTAFGALLIFLFMAFGAPHSPTPMLLFLGAYIVALAGVRIERLGAEARGELRHTRYNGEPRLWRFFPKLDEITIKSKVEPMLVMVIGFVTLSFAPPLGCYLIVSAIALGISVSQVVAYENAKAAQAVDNMLDSRMHAQRVRERMGNVFMN